MNLAALKRRARYFAWASARFLEPDLSCPWCGDESGLVTTKALVTQLRECRHCRLRFRVPKDDLAVAEQFYELDYEQGFTTGRPTDTQLQRLLETGFVGSAKDYRVYLSVIAAAGVPSGSKVLDFGSSWGYGSWQLSADGYQVQSYELSQSRARYAHEKLACTVVSDPLLAAPVDCLFAAHVLEHLAQPQIFWDLAQKVTAASGWIICFVPNGSPALESVYGARTYHRLWGQVHPLLLNGDSLRAMASRNGFTASVHSSPYALDRIAAGASDTELLGHELLVIGRRS